MTTIHDKEFIFKLILDDGKYPGDDDVWAIWQYQSNFDTGNGNGSGHGRKRPTQLEVFRYPRYPEMPYLSNFKVVRNEKEMISFLQFGNYDWTHLVFPFIYPEMDDAFAARMRQRRGELITTLRDLYVPELDWGRIFF